jgi:hypothetical protein
MVVVGMMGFVASFHLEAPRFIWHCQRDGRVQVGLAMKNAAYYPYPKRCPFTSG